MSTETVNLFQMTDQQLSERAADVRDAMSATIDDADDTDYWNWSDEQARIETEQKRRAKPKPAPKAKEPKAPTTHSELLAAKREELAEAEASLAELAGMKPRDPNKPPPEGSKPGEDDPAAEKPGHFMRVESLKGEIALLEARVPFEGKSDEEVAASLEDVAVERERLQVEAKRLTEEGRHRAAAKAQREASEIQDKLMPLVAENEARKSERRNAVLVDAGAERLARRKRTDALASWKVEVAKREQAFNEAMARDDGIFHVASAELREAKQAVEEITKLIGGPITKSELAEAREMFQEYASSIQVSNNAVEASW